jgi:hypothetical protein
MADKGIVRKSTTQGHAIGTSKIRSKFPSSFIQFSQCTDRNYNFSKLHIYLEEF